MYTQALTCVKTSAFFFVLKGKGNRRPPHQGFSGTKPFTDGVIYNTCFLLLRKKIYKACSRRSDSGVRCQGRQREIHPTPPPRCFFLLTSLCAIPTI